MASGIIAPIISGDTDNGRFDSAFDFYSTVYPISYDKLYNGVMSDMLDGIKNAEYLSGLIENGGQAGDAFRRGGIVAYRLRDLFEAAQSVGETAGLVLTAAEPTVSLAFAVRGEGEVVPQFAGDVASAGAGFVAGATVGSAVASRLISISNRAADIYLASTTAASRIAGTARAIRWGIRGAGAVGGGVAGVVVDLALEELGVYDYVSEQVAYQFASNGPVGASGRFTSFELADGATAIYDNSTGQGFVAESGWLFSEIAIDGKPVLVASNGSDPGGIRYIADGSGRLHHDNDALAAEAVEVRRRLVEYYQEQKYCFAPETPIDMADGSTRPIAEISPGDWVMSFDQTAHGGRGGLVARRVTAVHVNKARHLLDFHGTRVTPGHVFLRAEGGFAPLLDILRADGAVVDAKGQAIRACTGFPVGSAEDVEIEILFYPHGADGPTVPGKLRGGTRLRIREGSDETETLLEMLARHGCELLSDGTVRKPGREAGPLPWPGAPVEPYAHLLRVSGYRSIEQLYDDPASWEGRDPRQPSSALM